MRSIIDIISKEYKEEIMEDYDLKNEKDILTEFELTGDFYLGTDSNPWDDMFYFDFGPQVDGGYLSDSIYTDDYLERIGKYLKLKLDVGLSENSHGMYVDTEEEYLKNIERIIEFIKSDGFEVHKNDIG